MNKLLRLTLLKHHLGPLPFAKVSERLLELHLEFNQLIDCCLTGMTFNQGLEKIVNCKRQLWQTLTNLEEDKSTLWIFYK